MLIYNLLPVTATIIFKLNNSSYDTAAAAAAALTPAALHCRKKQSQLRWNKH